jgi:ADP-heptose:LPS heptosyltransferase
MLSIAAKYIKADESHFYRQTLERRRTPRVPALRLDRLAKTELSPTADSARPGARRTAGFASHGMIARCLHRYTPKYSLKSPPPGEIGADTMLTPEWNARVVKVPQAQDVAPRYPKARPVMRGRYLLSRPELALIMGAADLLVNGWPRRRPALPSSPNRILVANWAHLGDVLTTLPAIAWLRRRYPKAEIGLLTGSWSGPIAEASSEFVDRIHLVDHFVLARSGDIPARLRRHRDTARRARAEIRDAGYDAALDFYAYFPTAAPFLAGCKVPVRIGWSSGGLGGFYTHQVRRSPGDRHIIDRHRDILSALAPDAGPEHGALRPTYAAAATPLPPHLDGGSYVLVHTGAGTPHKEWLAAKWIELAKRLVKDGERVVLVGAGPRECARCAEICAAVPSAIDLSGQLTWPELVAAIAQCRALYCLESVPGHLAAVFQRPTIVISGGMTSPSEWGPANPKATIVTGDTPCAPCHRRGCNEMYCLSAVSAGDVWSAGTVTTGRQPPAGTLEWR